MSIHALSKDEGPAYWFLNHLVIVRVSAQQTGNAFSLVEMLASPGPGSPYHVHREEDETFYVIEGELEFISGEQRFTRGPGSSVFLPRNIPHGFRIVGPTPARFLVLSNPGNFDRFAIEVGAPAQSRTLPTPSQPDMARLNSLAMKYQIEILGPLPE